MSRGHRQSGSSHTPVPRWAALREHTGCTWTLQSSPAIRPHPLLYTLSHKRLPCSPSTAGLVGRAIWHKFRHADSRTNVVKCLPDYTAASPKTLQCSSAEIMKLVCRKMLRLYCLCNNKHIEEAHNAEGADIRCMVHIPHVSDIRCMVHIPHVSDVRYMVHIPYVPHPVLLYVHLK
jgi:hypothetical protein